MATIPTSSHVTEPHALMQQSGGGLIHVAIQDGEASHVAVLDDTTTAVDAWAADRGYVIDRDTTVRRDDGVYVSAVKRHPAEPYVLIHQPRGEDGWEAVEVAVHAPDATFPTVGYLKDSSAAVEKWLADLGWEADRTRQERNGTITRFPLIRTAKAAADDLLAKAQANVQAAEVALAEAKATLALVEHAVRATR